MGSEHCFSLCLVYGASKSLPPFFLPWLVFQVLFVAVVLAVTILVLVLAWPHRRKAFAVLPCTVAVIGVALWIKVCTGQLGLTSDPRTNVFLHCFLSGARSLSEALKDEEAFRSGILGIQSSSSNFDGLSLACGTSSQLLQ